MTIRLSVQLDALRIYFDDCLHVHLRRSKLLAIHAWRWSSTDCSIEWVMHGNTLVTEYDDEAKWRAILQELDRIDYL